MANQEKVAEGISEDIFTMSRELRDLRDKKGRMEDDLKTLNGEIKVKNELLVKQMVDAELQKFSLDGTLFYLATETYVSSIPDTRTEFYSVLEKEGYGDLVQPNIPAPTLGAFVKEMFSDNDDVLPDWLLPYVTVYQADKVKLMKDSKRKSKKKEEEEED